MMIAGLVGCDHATKHVARAALGSGRVLTLVPGVLDLRYAENRGTAFSVLEGARSPFTLALLISLSAIALTSLGVWWWRRRHERAASQIGFAMIVGGAIGNLIDRAARGFVIDFVHLHHWPVFNVADVAITAGVGLLLLDALRRRREPAATAPPS